jgi:TP901 family phage tail tape measure protein
MAAPINIPVNVQLQNVSQLQRQIQQATQNIRINLVNGNSARSLTALSQPLGRLTGQADEFTKSMDAANARVLAFGASVGVLNAFSNAFKSLIASTIEVEKALKAITVVGDQFAGSTKELGQGLFNVAKLTGQSFAEVSKAALEFSRQGLKLEDTLQRTQDALILTRLTGLDSAKAVDGLTAAFNAFSKAGLSTSQILNKLAAVDQAFAVSSADLIEGFNRSAAVAQNAGVSFDELAGIITALQQETSRGGAVIGNALKTIFTRIQDKDTLVKLRELGITVEDVQGKILPARQILQNLAKDVQGLGEITKAGIFKDVAGTFQINQLISLVGDLNKQNSIAADATRKSAGATNEAYVANEKLNQSLDAILNKVAVSGKQIGSILGDLGISDNLKGLLDGLNSFLESASNVLQGDDIGAKFAQGLVKGIGSVLTGPGVGLFLAIIGKLTYDFIKFSAQGLKTFFNIGQAAKQQQQIQESIVQTLLRNQSVLSQIVNTQGGQNAQAQAFLNILRQEEQALQNIRTLAGGIAAPVIAAGYTTGSQGLRRRSAGGYLPAQEAADVRRGVGGASPSSKVVAIPNFAFGGGKRGTMIANTSEYIVPNYAGGGSAIFNQDMAKTMGLPPGAKKISAAGGFVPNFADNKKTIIDETGTFAMIVNDQDGIQEYTASPEKDKSIAYKFNSYGIPSVTQLKNKKGGTFAGSRFTNESLIQRYTKAAIKESNAYALAIGGRQLAPFEIEKLSNPGVVKGLVGAIFESGIGGVINGEGLKKAQSDQKSNALIDFERQPQINKFFGIDPEIEYVEAKYKASSDALKSMANKIYNVKNKSTFNVSNLTQSEKETLRKQWESSGGKGAIYGELVKKFGLKLGTNQSQRDATKAEISRILSASGGYIPNFASTALQAAISRERSAGVSPSQIYVDQSPALQSSANPMGLMVANRRDEPAGGFQGISRARKEGRNPKTYGAANGFVPNFFSLQAPNASQYTAPANSSSSSSPPAAPNPANIEAVNKGFADTAGKIFLLQSAMSFLNGALGEADTSLGRFTQELSNTSANITSLALFGKEIADIKIDGNGLKSKFGNFAKGLGLVGIGFAAVTEGFKLLDFGIKEFSGANKRAADALAGLETAAQGALVSLNDLTPTGQRAAQESGKAALESFSGSFLSNLFTDAAGKNPEIQKNVGLLAAQGIKSTDLKSRIEEQTKQVFIERIQSDKTLGFQKLSKEKVAEMIPDIEKYIIEEDLSKAVAQLFSNPEVLASGRALNSVKAGFESGKFNKDTNFSDVIGSNIQGIENIDTVTLQSLIDAQKLLASQKADAVKLQKEEALGEKVSLELQKQKIDALIEQKKLQIDLNAEKGSESLRLELETLDASEQYKNNLQKKIALQKIDSDLLKTNLDILKSSIDQLTSLPSDNALGISSEQAKAIGETLKNLDIQTVAQLEEKITEIGGKLGLFPKQLEKTIALFKDQFIQAQENADAQKAAAKYTADFNDKLIQVRNNLEAGKIAAEKIADAIRIASESRLSTEGIGFNAAENRIKNLRDRASASKSDIERLRLEKEAYEEERKLNDLKRTSSAKTFDEQKQIAEARKKQASDELFRKRFTVSSSGLPYDQNQIDEAAKAYNEAVLALQKLNDENTIANQNFNQQSESLQRLQDGLYKTIGALTAYENSLFQFQQGAGERIGGAMLEQLGATDIDSLIKARIKEKVEGQAQAKLQSGDLNNADYYKSIQEGVRLGELRYEQAVAESEVRRRELDYEIKYTEELIALKKKGATEEELIAAKKRQIEEQRSGKRGLERGLDAVQDKINNYRTTFAEEIPALFSSNLAQGLSDAISGAKSLKDALRDAATSFLNAITQKNIENLANLFTSGIGGAGKALFKANGGMISGGSGTKDDVPAMLMGGEYVIKKSAVKKYGSRFLDSLNNGGVQAFAAGGGVQSGKGGFYVPGDFGEGAITGKNQLLAFAGQSFTGGQYDRMGGFGMSGASISLEPESARLTAYGRENSPIFERVQQSKEEAFNVYLDQLKQESAYREQLKQMEEAEKARKKQLQTAIISAVVSSAVSYAGSAMAAGGSNALGAANQAATASGKTLSLGSKFTTYLGGALGKGGATGTGGLGNVLSGNFSNAITNYNSLAKANGIGNPQYFSNNGRYGGVYYGTKALPVGEGFTNSYNPLLPNVGWRATPLAPYQRASGGFISGGSGMRDDVPAMLTGGEFVLNNRATRKLGVQNLNRLNAGATESQQSSGGVSDALISKLDELIQTTRESSKENVVVNVSGMETGGEKRSDENKSSNDRELQRKIREAVLAVIAQEKRLGGSLNK